MVFFSFVFWKPFDLKWCQVFNLRNVYTPDREHLKMENWKRNRLLVH